MSGILKQHSWKRERVRSVEVWQDDIRQPVAIDVANSEPRAVSLRVVCGGEKAPLMRRIMQKNAGAIRGADDQIKRTVAGARQVDDDGIERIAERCIADRCEKVPGVLSVLQEDEER